MKLNVCSSLAVRLVLIASLTYAYINIEQYCKAFDDHFRPMICILKNTNTSSVDRPYPQDTVAPNYPILIPEKIKAKLNLRPKLPPRPRPRPRPRPHPIFPHHRPPPIYIPSKPDYSEEWENDDEEVDCSCDLNCYPIISNQNPNVTGVSYRCRSCGSSCWVRSLLNTNCSCAVPSGNATCTCVASCASFRSDLGFGLDFENTAKEDVDVNVKTPRMSWGWSSTDEDDDSNSDSVEDLNCIFNISNLTDTRIGEEQRPYNCACCKSTEAQRTSDPDFVCICQRVSITQRQESIQLPNDSSP